MRRLLLFPVVLALAAAASAQVLRCADASGKVSYTDGACPDGSRSTRQVTTQEPVSVLPDPAGARRAAAARAPQPYDAASVPPAPPAGAVILDSRGNADAATEPQTESRWNTERGSDVVVIDDGSYGYPYAGARRPPPPARDKRARLRDCDGSSCRDGMGNTYNSKTGQLQRYQSIDGKTCRPVNGTTVCR